jgi:SAM-dependent methyltransferase
MNSMVQSAYLHYGNLYDDDKDVRRRYAKYVSLLKERVKGKSRLLEIGCYTAELAELLPKNIDYVGVDFDEAALEIAASKGRNVRKLDFNTHALEFKEKFDIIIAAEVLEHLLDPARLMVQISNVLKEDGLVIFSLPNENTLYHRLVCLLGFGIDLCSFQLYKHLHFPTLRQSVQFVSGYFRIIKKDYYINPRGKGARFEKLGMFTQVIPDWLWEGLAYMCPSLFARGIILLCEPYAQ